jgi:hypothetical protein
MKKQAKKLVLAKETVRDLITSQHIQGGWTGNTCGVSYTCMANTCNCSASCGYGCQDQGAVFKPQTTNC